MLYLTSIFSNAGSQEGKSIIFFIPTYSPILGLQADS